MHPEKAHGSSGSVLQFFFNKIIEYMFILYHPLWQWCLNDLPGGFFVLHFENNPVIPEVAYIYGKKNAPLRITVFSEIEFSQVPVGFHQS